MNKKRIFISHATPNDNYFTTWLASKLKLVGYEVWVELDELKSGDAFWPEIENAIRNQAIKFLSVISASYVSKITDPRAGVFKELSCADRISGIKNFKTPIRIENVDEDIYPVQLMGLNSVDFYNNWQLGLEKLLESFEKEKVPRNESQFENPLNFWLNSFGINEVVNSSVERIYTNWFPFQLPSNLYVHKPIVESKIDLVDVPYSFLEYSDRHISFFPQEDYPPSISCATWVELNIKEIIEERFVQIDESLILTDPRKKIIELVNKVFSQFLTQIRLKRYEQSNTNVFYFPSTVENRKRINLNRIGKNNVAIAGKTKGEQWSFGISVYAILYPFPCFRVNSHIIFENTDFLILEPEKQHELRRKFAFDWYNKDWLDTLIGLMIKVSADNQDSKILINISSSEVLTVSAIPYWAQSDFGYVEPVKIETDEV